MKTGVELIAEERQRQIKKGYTPEHDEEHSCEELATAGACYAIWDSSPSDSIRLYPFKEPLHAKLHSIETIEQKADRYARAGALIAAAIDRLLTINT